MLFPYVWPLLLVILSNVVYQICAKSVPNTVHPLAALTVTYLVGAAVSAGLYFALNRGGDLVRELAHVNWAPFLLGIVIVGLEVGMIYAYKAGWAVNTLSVVQSTIVALALLFVAAALYHEPLSTNKVIGMVICLVGLFFINR